MTYYVEWGLDDAELDEHGQRRMDTVEELDAVLDTIVASAARMDTRFAVYVLRDEELDADHLPSGLQLCLGHAERSHLGWMDTALYAVDEALPPWPREILFDYGGQPFCAQPHETRTTPGAARAAAREYVATGRRPENVRWVPAFPEREAGPDNLPRIGTPIPPAR